MEVINSSVVKVSWKRVHKDKLHGHLGGYRVILEKQTFALKDCLCIFKGLSVTFLSQRCGLLLGRYRASLVLRPPEEQKCGILFTFAESLIEASTFINILLPVLYADKLVASPQSGGLKEKPRK